MPDLDPPPNDPSTESVDEPVEGIEIRMIGGGHVPKHGKLVEEEEVIRLTKQPPQVKSIEDYVAEPQAVPPTPASRHPYPAKHSSRVLPRHWSWIIGVCFFVATLSGIILTMYWQQSSSGDEQTQRSEFVPDRSGANQAMITQEEVNALNYQDDSLQHGMSGKSRFESILFGESGNIQAQENESAFSRLGDLQQDEEVKVRAVLSRGFKYDENWPEDAYRCYVINDPNSDESVFGYAPRGSIQAMQLDQELPEQIFRGASNQRTVYSLKIKNRGQATQRQFEITDILPLP